MNSNNFVSFDGAKIFYREWNFSPSQKTIIIFHRGHEHSGRLAEFATDDRFTKYNIFAFDLRGHGKTKQAISPNFMDYERDIDAFVNFLNDKYAILTHDIFIVANSISAIIVSAWIHDFAPQIAGMALLAPAFAIKLYVPFAKEFVTLGTKLNKNLVVKSYVKSKMLTHDQEQQKAYDTDPLISKSINGVFLVDCINSGKRIVDDAAAINTPTLILSADKDYVVQKEIQKKFFINLESETKEFIELKDFYHGILFEKERTVVYDHILRFMQECYILPRTKVNLKADKFSKDEYFTLSLKMIPFMERANFSFMKWALDKVSSLSNGMKIGMKYGFDSGISLDYVYKNKPKGKLGIGKMIDNSYLNAIGWRGIRKRKENLLTQIEAQISRLKQANRPVKILDIAGGTGNYLFDIKEKHPDVEIIVNDFKKSNMDFGKKTLAEKKIEGMYFTNYDCFDPATYATLNFNPNITIISGIFELFEDNEMVSKAVSGVVSISEPDSVIIYTGQPWHPQLKMIAYVLTSHQDKDWVMRRRSQRELDSIFKFNTVLKESMLIDDYGIFTVSCGRIKN